MSELRKYRLTLAYMTVGELEVEAPNPAFAEGLGYALAEKVTRKHVSGPCVFRVEQRVPTAEPGKFEWREVPRA